MNLRIALLATFLSTQILACSAEPLRNVSSVPLQPGGRSGLHGMVVFGKGTYFIEHIPMLHPPHDFQILASITIKNKSGQILKPDLSKKSFTLKPKINFSLNDLIQGPLKQFEAELYEGSFEQNGKIVTGYEDLLIKIESIPLARQLPDTAKDTFFEITDYSGNIFRTEIITPQNNIQLIKNMNTHKTLWCVVGPDFFEFCP